MNFKKLTIYTLLITIVLTGCKNRTYYNNKIDKELSKYLNIEEKEKNPGTSILVSVKGKVVYKKTFGMADIDKKRPVQPETTFRIGSITKQFTATAILLLEERGELSLNDTLDKYMPDFPQGDEVTIYQLLNHTSGIKSFTSEESFFKTVHEYIEQSDMLNHIKELGYIFKPGEGAEYNNSGYFILGYIIEKVSGQSYGEFLTENIFTPLKMKNTGVYKAGLNLKNDTTGYKRGYKRVVDWDLSRAGAAGNLYSNVNDLYKWNEALFKGRVLSEESLQKAHTRSTLKNGEIADFKMFNYGLGWVIRKQGSDIICHDGRLAGFRTSMSRIPELDANVIVLSNTDQYLPEKISYFLIQLLNSERS